MQHLELTKALQAHEQLAQKIIAINKIKNKTKYNNKNLETWLYTDDNKQLYKAIIIMQDRLLNVHAQSGWFMFKVVHKNYVSI